MHTFEQNDGTSLLHLSRLSRDIREEQIQSPIRVRDTMTNAATGNIPKIHLASNAICVLYCMRPEGMKRPRSSAVNTVHH